MTINDNDRKPDLFTLVDDDGMPIIKVVGVGGGGGNAVNHMIQSNIEGVEFICANTDGQALRKLESSTNIQLGGELTKGLGAGAKPDVGREAAIYDRDRIAEALKGSNMVFITAGMGGGTGTGAAPIVAEVAKSMDILTVAVVTKPFPMEGSRRMQVAEAGLEELSRHVDSLITIPNQKLQKVLGPKVTLLQAFAEANNVLLNAVKGIAELITRDGMINVDFADVQTVMSEMGNAMMGSGTASGEDRAIRAAEEAINSPLLDDIDLTGAKGILINITSGPDIGLDEFEIIGDTIRAHGAEDAQIIVGSALDMDMSDEVRVTVVATGLNKAQMKPKVAVDNTRDMPAPTITARRPVTRPEATAVKHDSIETQAGTDMDILDVPTFLRRQAD